MTDAIAYRRHRGYLDSLAELLCDGHSMRREDESEAAFRFRREGNRMLVHPAFEHVLLPILAERDRLLEATMPPAYAYRGIREAVRESDRHMTRSIGAYRVQIDVRIPGCMTYTVHQTVSREVAGMMPPRQRWELIMEHATHMILEHYGKG